MTPRHHRPAAGCDSLHCRLRHREANLRWSNENSFYCRFYIELWPHGRVRGYIPTVCAWICVHLCVWVCVFSVDLTCRLIGVCGNDPSFHRLSWMLLLFIKFYKTCMMWPWRTLSSDNALVIWKNQRWTQDVWAGRARKINWQPLALEENCKGHFCSISLNMGAAFLCRLNTVNVVQLIKRLWLLDSCWTKEAIWKHHFGL